MTEKNADTNSTTANAANTRRRMQDILADRFLHYAAVTSQSDASGKTIPTTEGQRTLATLIASELNKAGAADVHISTSYVVTARIPARLPEGHAPVPAVGFIAHLDTADVDLSPNVRASIIEYPGGDICLNEAKDIWMRVAEHPVLERYKGERLLVTHGTSVLGADDKAGITIIMETVLRLLDGQGPDHGDIYVAFVPDEEIGLRGIRTLDLDRFPVQYAYTVDGGEMGEIVAECFNAASATVRIEGVAAHPISAKGVMVNPILVANDLIAKFDRTQTPENTEGREGYIWVEGVRGNQSKATIDINIRDFDRTKFEQRKDEVRAIVQQTAQEHPRAKVTVEIEDVYGNIADAVTDQNRAGIDLMREALAEIGVEPIEEPMRGGTDGSWLSAQGLLTPNLFTGGHNFHSRYEFLPLNAFERAYAMVNSLIGLIAKRA